MLQFKIKTLTDGQPWVLLQKEWHHNDNDDALHESQTKMMHHILPMIMIDFVNAWKYASRTYNNMNERQAMQRTLNTKFIFQEILDSGSMLFLLQSKTSFG